MGLTISVLLLFYFVRDTQRRRQIVGAGTGWIVGLSVGATLVAILRDYLELPISTSIQSIVVSISVGFSTFLYIHLFRSPSN